MFRIPPITKNLLIINLLAFFATFVLQMRGFDLADIGGLHFFMASNFHLYQLVTYLFLHANFMHILSNMFGLWMFGCILAFGMTFPNERLFIIPFPFPIKAKWFVMGYVAIEFFSALASSGDGVAHTAHLGGMLFGYLMIRYWNHHPDSGYDRSRGQQFFDNLKRNFDQRRQNQGGSGYNGYENRHMHAEHGSKQDDMEYNARKKQNQEEIDAILDKIRKSGYDSLTKEEKKKLFDASNQR